MIHINVSSYDSTTPHTSTTQAETIKMKNLIQFSFETTSEHSAWKWSEGFGVPICSCMLFFDGIIPSFLLSLVVYSPKAQKSARRFRKSTCRYKSSCSKGKRTFNHPVTAVGHGNYGMVEWIVCHFHRISTLAPSRFRHCTTL